MGLNASRAYVLNSTFVILLYICTDMNTWTSKPCLRQAVNRKRKFCGYFAIQHLTEKQLMRILLFSTVLYTLVACRQPLKKAKEFPILIEMFSPKSNLSLDLKNGKFVLDKNEFSSDQIFSTEITTGSYFIESDILTLRGVNDKTYTLKIETEEILQPINFDTLKQSHKFLAWTTYHTNGQIKQSGGWTENNEKEGVWTFYNEKGNIKNQKLYDKGKIVNDNFKFDIDK